MPLQEVPSRKAAVKQLMRWSLGRFGMLSIAGLCLVGIFYGIG